MKPRVYVETSVISYLTNRPALDVITAGHQATTYKWWEEQRSNYDLVVSQFVLDEAASGDPAAAARRVATLIGITRLNVNRPENQSTRANIVGAASASTKSICRRFAYRRVRSVGSRNPPDMEFQAHCKRRDDEPYRARLL